MQRLITAAALIAALFVPSTALAAPGGTTDQCAIGYTGDDSFYPDFPEIRVYGSTAVSAEVGVDAATCTTLISAGNWQGASKYRADWDREYTQVCLVHWTFNPSVSLMVWGDPSRDGAMALAEDDCAGFATQSDSRVTYY